MLIKTQEHTESFCFLPQFEPKSISNVAKGDVFCGLHYDFLTGQKQLKTHYFIGACWLEINQLALQVEPKIKNIDYLTMFSTCFKHPKISQGLGDIYEIEFNQARIDLESNNSEITLLLIVHFLQVVKVIVRKGLKKGYYPITENLNAKIKGKINIANTLKRNVFSGKNHKIICHYQAFGVDCLENRLLKKALLFVQSYLAKSNSKSNKNLRQILAYCLAPFELVSNEIGLNEIKYNKQNAFYQQYSKAISLAKMILKYFSYNLQNTSAKHPTPPFYIDMALLFEKYVYALLLENHQVEYQFEYTDFLVGDMIVDSKYKLQYKDDYEKDDIGQLSRYARNKKICEKLGLDDEIIKCLIIYPDQQSNEILDKDLWQQATEIPKFKEFKKIAIKLPSK